jgi:nicotinamide mononucleotide transporter
MSARERLVWAGVGLGGTLALGTVMQRFTDAALPYLDACATALSLVAQWLMNRKVLESWVFWITVDVLSIGMYLAKGLRLTALLYAAYLIMATMGLFAWKKTLRAAPAA